MTPVPRSKWNVAWGKYIFISIETSSPVYHSIEGVWYIIHEVSIKNEFDVFSGFMTSNDLFWPRNGILLKFDVASVILIIKILHLLSTFNSKWSKIWNLTPVAQRLKKVKLMFFFSEIFLMTFSWEQKSCHHLGICHYFGCHYCDDLQ